MDQENLNDQLLDKWTAAMARKLREIQNSNEIREYRRIPNCPGGGDRLVEVVVKPHQDRTP